MSLCYRLAGGMAVNSSITGDLSAALHTNNRDQRQAQGIEPAQQALQSSLVEGAGQGGDRRTLALVLDLCWRIGATQDDERVAEVVAFVQGLQGPYGLWKYVPHPQASRWVTFDILRSFSRMNSGVGDWLGFELRTPFQAYPRKERRY